MGRWKGLMRLVSVAAGLFALGCATHTTSTAIRTTVCELRERQEYFGGKQVVLRAAIDGDGHLLAVRDSHCPQKGAGLKFSEIALRDGYAAPINEAVLQKMSGQPIKSITATLTGTFSLNRSDGLVAVLIVDRVDDLDIERAR